MHAMYSDDDIERLWRLPKTVTNLRAKWIQRLQLYLKNKQTIYKVIGIPDTGGPLKFLVFQRQSLEDASSYSSGILCIPPQGPELIMARHNRAIHHRGNVWNRPKFSGPQRQPSLLAGNQNMKLRKRRDSEEALACLLQDFRIIGLHPSPVQLKVFDDH